MNYMFITAMYLYGMIQGAFPGAILHLVVAFIADLAIAGAIGSEPMTVVK